MQNSGRPQLKFLCTCINVILSRKIIFGGSHVLRFLCSLVAENYAAHKYIKNQVSTPKPAQHWPSLHHVPWASAILWMRMCLTLFLNIHIPRFSNIQDHRNWEGHASGHFLQLPPMILSTWKPLMSKDDFGFGNSNSQPNSEHLHG